MFDSETARLLRSAPAVPGLDSSDIPSLLTWHYANLVSARLRGDLQRQDSLDGDWTLDRLADTYEVIAAVHHDKKLRTAAAFVAGTARQIVARRMRALDAGDEWKPNIDRDHLDPALAAPVLFLAAEQYADANEAAAAIISPREGQIYEATILVEQLVDLARGNLLAIIERANRWRRPSHHRSLEEQAFVALLETLVTGIEILAANFLNIGIPEASGGRYESPEQAFQHVLSLSAQLDVERLHQPQTTAIKAHAGPHHLASLLLCAYDGLMNASLTSIPPPVGADPGFWNQWISHRAQKFPFVWANHREAVAKGFHQIGHSAVVILPTGAGKTTVSSLKVAGVLAAGKSVVFLVPTHALVDQLTAELQEIFPNDLLGSVVSSDFDLLFQTDAQLREIEVMTPERCLAMLSFAPNAFSNVGLLVFDECHLLSPQSGKIRRALDGMLCVLGFSHAVPRADMLFLSAMLKNGEDFSHWIGQLTGRTCVSVDLLWKPSRQARGVVIYKVEDLKEAQNAALYEQYAQDKRTRKQAKTLRTTAGDKLTVLPWAIWGLKHNWLDRDSNTASIITSKLQDRPVKLTGHIRHGAIRLTPNANRVAATLAVTAARNGLKAIVFVNTKADAVSTAKLVADELNHVVEASASEKTRWEALEAELGGLQHSVLSGPSTAVPHNSAMLRLERDLAENMFRRADGAKVIVATPTLAQGLNLPAHLAILAGDKRADAEKKGREALEAHEILNAAARAGRAGHLANGIVLLIPEPIMSVSADANLTADVVSKLESVLPEDDRCVLISDPLEIVLDRLMQGDVVHPDVRYLINRMATLRDVESGEEPTLMFDIRKSFGAYGARAKGTHAAFELKLLQLRTAIDSGAEDTVATHLAMLAAQSGLPIDLLARLESRVSNDIGTLPTSIEGWVVWTVEWLKEDEEARSWLFHDSRSGLLGACGRKKDGELTSSVLDEVLPGLLAWIHGAPVCNIEKALSGSPESNSQSERICPRARELLSGVVPRGFSFAIGLVSHVVERVDPFEAQQNLDRQLIEVLGSAVRKGYDLPEILHFANANSHILSRVQVHQGWAQDLPF